MNFSKKDKKKYIYTFRIFLSHRDHSARDYFYIVPFCENLSKINISETGNPLQFFNALLNLVKRVKIQKENAPSIQTKRETSTNSTVPFQLPGTHIFNSIFPFI